MSALQGAILGGKGYEAGVDRTNSTETFLKYCLIRSLRLISENANKCQEKKGYLDQECEKRSLETGH